MCAGQIMKVLRSKMVSIKVKIRIIKTVIRSTLIKNCETWTIINYIENKLGTWEVKKNRWDLT